jgi:hypothetical protein
MTKTEEYLASGDLIPSADPAWVTLRIDMLLKRSTVDNGGIDQIAALDGWTPDNPLNPPKFCVEYVKKLAQQKLAILVHRQLEAQALAQAPAIIESLV